MLGFVAGTSRLQGIDFFLFQIYLIPYFPFLAAAVFQKFLAVGDFFGDQIVIGQCATALGIGRR